MTLHEAILMVLQENTDGMSLQEIADQINQRKLYEKKDKSTVQSEQVAIRINNYSHLFYIEKGKVHSLIDFDTRKSLFDNIIYDVISSTANDDISIKQVAIPLLCFLKRVVEADKKSYGLEITFHFREFFEEFQKNLSNIKETEYKSGLFSIVNELFEINYQLEPARLIIIDIVKNHRPGMFLDIHKVLNRYSFDSNTFTNKEFGYFFNSLIDRLAKSVSHMGRYSTPDDINKIITSLYNENSHSLMDPFAGTAGTLIKRQQWNDSPNIIGYEKHKEPWVVGTFNLILNGIDPLFFYNSNSLKASGIFKKKANLIITDIPFSGSFKNNEFDFLHWAKTKDSTSIYLQYIIDSLENNGKAVVVVPQGFLFSSNTSVKQLKKELVENDWLDAVISLPPGIFLPYASIASAILCINFNKSSKNNCLLIDATDIKLNKAVPKELSIDDENIDTILHIFRERPKKYESPTKIYAGTFSADEITDQAFDLSPKRYVYADTKEAQMELFGDEFVQLGEVLSKASETFDFSADISANQISGKDLKSTISNYVLTNENIPKTNITKGKNLDLLSQNALLILTHFTNLKPTYFVYQAQPVLLPNAIKAFRIDEQRVLPEYIVTQLHEPYFVKQLDSIRKGSAQLYFSIKDFFRLKIRLPKSLEQQKKIYETAKEKLLEKRAGEADILTQELAKQKAAALSDQITIISSIQHELGNKLPALKNSIDDLKTFIQYAGNLDSAFSMESKIRPVLLGENQNEIDSLKNVFERVESILNYTISMVDDAGGIINSDPSRFKPQKTKLLEYLNSEVKNFQRVHGKVDNVKFEILDEEGPVMNIDKKQFTKALNNLLLNAIRHGFTDGHKEYRMVFQLVPDDNYDILIIKNDGIPFPEDFTIQKYKQPYQYSGKTGHSGLGGYIINRVVENHNGTMDLLRDIDPADTFKVQFEFKFPKVYFL